MTTARHHVCSKASALPGAKGEGDMRHRFRAGQTVRLVRSSLRTVADGEFKVIRPLPDDGGEAQYRIKSRPAINQANRDRCDEPRLSSSEKPGAPTSGR